MAANIVPSMEKEACTEIKAGRPGMLYELHPVK